MKRTVASLAVLGALLCPSVAGAQWHSPNCSPTRWMMFTTSQQWGAEISQQNNLQARYKQQLLIYALDAPRESLWRNLKHQDPFVRWAAAVEWNRRLRIEKAVAMVEARQVLTAAIVAPAETRPAPEKPLQLKSAITK